MRTLILTGLLALSGSLCAQFSVNNTNDIQQIIDGFVGDGVTVVSYSFYGEDIQIGTFTYTGNQFSINDGLVISTGNVDTLVGPNNSNSAGTEATGAMTPNNNPEVAFLDPFDENGNGKYDVAFLEIDFIPETRDLAFNYVFASEEYPEFVNDIYNDGFCMLLSGPGIAGPYVDNAVNIALVPGTTTPISINNVNDGLNSEYYVDNNQNNGQNYMQFDGYTTELTASYQLPNCNDTYKIRIAIMDLGDGAYDSAVLLKANSLSSGVGTMASLEGVTTCPNEMITLSPEITVPDNVSVFYSWDNGAHLEKELTVLTGLNSETHVLTISDDCGTEQVLTAEIEIDCPITEVNIFTPNGDNVNDVFNFSNLVHYPNSHIEIFNRWGKLVYQKDNIIDGWNGKIKGSERDASAGTYFYYITAPTGESWRGFLTLMR